MTLLRFLFIPICCGILLVTQTAFALEVSRPLPTDPRIHIVTYNPNDVIKFTGYYEYQSSIVFGKNEVINTISMGTPTAWQVVPSGNRLFLKPIEKDATTNMTLITNKRVYLFELHAREVDPDEGINDSNLVFVTRFVYPNTDSNDGGGVMFFGGHTSGPDLSHPEKYNFNYTISGSDEIAPTRIFDDGEFTYFQFPRKNAEIPAFFRVASDGSESMINYRVQGNYIVMERVVSQLTLRKGNEVTCIFNEARPLKKKKAQ